MDSSYAIQYTIVGVIIIVALIRIIMGLRKMHKKAARGEGGCLGCTLADSCTRIPKEKNKEKHDCHVE